MRIASALLALGLMTSSGLAADILEPIAPVEPVVVEEAAFSWTGAYFGLNAGWAFAGGIDGGHVQHRRQRCDPDLLCDRRDIRIRDGGKNWDLNGPFAGLQLGANWQVSQFVIGAETDLQLANITGDQDGADRRRRDVVFGFRSDRDVEIDWFGTARLRAGVAFERALVYGTGGFAYGGFDDNHHVDIHDPVDDRRRRLKDDNNDTDWGYALGAGVEYAFTDAISVGAEYQYINLGGDDDGRRSGREDQFRFAANDPEVDFHSVRVKVNFLMGAGSLF